MNYALSLAEKIRNSALALADIETEIAIAKQKLDALEAQAEGEAAMDATLKNDKQRTYAAFKALQANPEYEPLLEEIRQLTHDRSMTLAELEFNRNQLSISKLAQRSRIVDKLEQCELAELAA